VASLVDDGATMQMGIGGIPNAVLTKLVNHKNLGVHTEMFSDGVIPLVESGVINNSAKRVVPGQIVSSFIMGSQKVYDFLHDNPQIAMMDCSFVNDVRIIRRNPKVTAINSAIEIDLTGQVCADSIGTKHYSGVGGQIDFIRGASYSRGGKPIIAISSQTGKGISKIVPTLRLGAGVVSTRANVHYVITEYGIAYLYGQSMKERARRMIKIAHPDHREKLEKAAYDRWGGHWGL
jgi:acyl-CoA hydrolase